MLMVVAACFHCVRYNVVSVEWDTLVQHPTGSHAHIEPLSTALLSPFIILSMFNHSWAQCHKSVTKSRNSQPPLLLLLETKPVVQDVIDTHECQDVTHPEKELWGDSRLYSTELKGDFMCEYNTKYVFSS